MPLLPTRREDGKRSRTIAVNLAVLIPAVVGLILHHIGTITLSDQLLSADWTFVVMALLGILMRILTRQGLVRAPKKPRGPKGPTGTLIVLGLVLAAGNSCGGPVKTIERAGAGHIASAAVDTTTGMLLVVGEQDAADAVAAAHEGVVQTTLAALEYPTDYLGIAEGVLEATAQVLWQQGLEGPARFVKLALPAILWALEKLGPG